MEMTLDEYQVAALRTWSAHSRPESALTNAALGLGEAGEVQNLIKKHVYHGHTLDIAGVKKELGDVLYYVAVLAEEIGFDLSEIAQANIVKLETRYPDGFDPERSKNRED